MGAREDLLEAAKRLTRAGRPEFSPVDLMREARAGGSNYPDTTLRTFIAGPMCLNSPDHHALQYGDLVRVSHGRYRLAGATDSSASISEPPRIARPQPQAPPAATPHDEWFWEGNVQAAVVQHLASEGWRIRRVADTAAREQGVDIEATRDGVELLIEVKGYPSTTYSRGAKQGELKPTPPPLQARAYFSNALLSALIMRSERESARVVLAFPAMETYAALARRTVVPLSSAGIEVWLVDETGAVSSVAPLA